MVPQQPQQITVDISGYIEQKAKSVARIIKINGVPNLAIKRYHAETGAPIPLLVPITAEAVAAEKAKYTAIIAALDAVAADIAAAQEV